ncbi:MAG: XdhC /CoxI family-like protein [Acidocella sp. 20-57-95]|nr:MAG: XdhC /CoxI family-like protein [Acidocella sp. 20-57-95]OYV59832.1 MAG: XdhC /CoxI family-like protein [Acidocella sp. 21-58-7]HQT64779.1 XdhC family protein [Acidocella sp.]HQU04818.1 XdhC family protein [Acidocella sp.]
MLPAENILELANGLKAKGESFAMATVVRTVAATAAKAGAKALIGTDGTISGGWIGGGCARAAVLRAAAACLADGQPRLLSVQPEDVLLAQGVRSGEAKEGVQFAKNACPSKGTMDIFIEPYLPRPHLAVYGASPVAVAVAELASRMGFRVTVAAPIAEHEKFTPVDHITEDFSLGNEQNQVAYIVVATQGVGDYAALTAAMNSGANYIAFVASHKKAATLKEKLALSGVSDNRLASLRAPAGIDLGAITPDEIAFSIVGELIKLRRRGHRDAVA